MDETTQPTIMLKPREERRLRHGHLWVFSNEIAKISGPAEPGALVAVQASAGHHMGMGMYNPNSLIAVRMTTRGTDGIDPLWFRDRIARALHLRTILFPESTTYRLIHSESDGIPGVIVDRFDHVMVVQIASLGMEQRSDLLFDALMDIDGVDGVVERNDHSLRAMEGLLSRVGTVRGAADPQIIDDGFLRYHIDPLGGQKTGFYLDQRENRIALRRYMRQGSVLDLFANNGGFALHARHAGAPRVLAVDSSPVAIAEIERNVALNGLQPIETHGNDVFSELAELQLRKETFNTVVVDPPPFARSKKNVPAARKKYVELFAGAFSVTEQDGIALVATCSHHVTRETFQEIVRESLVRSRRSGIILEERGASPDHPVHPAMPETGYLHAAIIRVG